METKVKENGAAVNNGKPAGKEAAFINSNPVNKEAVKPEEAKAGEAKKDGTQEHLPQTVQTQPQKVESGEPKAEQPKATEQQPKAEPAKPAQDKNIANFIEVNHM